MTDKIREQIAWLRRELICNETADSLEKLLAVYEAANGYVCRKNDQGDYRLYVKMKDAIAALKELDDV